MNLECHDLADGRQSKWFECARDRHFTVADFRSQHFGGQCLFIELIAQL